MQEYRCRPGNCPGRTQARSSSASSVRDHRFCSFSHRKPTHQMTTLQKIAYTELNSRQKENYNFQKVAAHLADYGFNSLRLSDDWQGADFIACHIDGNMFLRCN
jgi:hypothetical protein